MRTPTDVANDVDAIVAPLIEGRWITGAVAALISGDQTVFRGYGRAREGDAAPDPDTVFEIGSATKVFTGLLLADMVARGEATLETPADALLPDGVALPTREGRRVLLLDLATHHAGLPSLPSAFAPADPQNPYAGFHEEQLLAAIRGASLIAAPGAQYAYSNFGYGLLGWLIARRAHATYEGLVTDRIAAPLGMSDTSVTLGASQRARLAEGHDVDGDPRPHWDLGALAGAGALRSTARDMVRFARANIGLPFAGPLADALRISHVPRREIAGMPPGSIALAWHVRPDGRTLWHNGQTGGFHAYVAFDAPSRLGVVVLANSASPQVDEIGSNALRLLRGERAQPIALPSAVTLDDAQLERFVGTYEIGPGVRLAVARVPGGGLAATLTGQPGFRIHPSGPHECRYRVVDATLTFDLGDVGPATGATLRQAGQTVAARRVEP